MRCALAGGGRAGRAGGRAGRVDGRAGGRAGGRARARWRGRSGASGARTRPTGYSAPGERDARGGRRPESGPRGRAMPGRSSPGERDALGAGRGAAGRPGRRTLLFAQTIRQQRPGRSSAAAPYRRRGAPRAARGGGDRPIVGRLRRAALDVPQRFALRRRPNPMRVPRIECGRCIQVPDKDTGPSQMKFY
jgi:hypothetical protein